MNTELDIKYREYIDNHRNNVKKAWHIIKSNSECVSLIASFIRTTPVSVTLKTVDDLIDAHDKTKYSEPEFSPYRKNFYPESEEEKASNKEAFDSAWKHHYTNNLHHWNWWHETGKEDEMGLHYVIEMICDWEAMGYNFGNTSKQFYEKNKETIFLGDTQRELAELLMNIINP